MDVRDQAISIGSEEQLASRPSKMANFRRRAGCCIKVSPWVTALSCIMVGLGLGIWYVYTQRALSATQDMSAQLLGGPVYLVEQLATAITWTRLIGLIAVCCMLGLTALASLLRTYQASARLPSTSCGSPGRLSYGSYAGLTALLNFAWWLLTLAVGLLIAANLVWLVVALLFSSALTVGVRSGTEAASISSPAYYATAKQVLNSLPTYAAKVQGELPKATASLPEVQAMNAAVTEFLSASKAVPVVACPASCLNLGSFYDALRLSTSCVCTDVAMKDIAANAEYLWKTLVHVLAALSLMGLGCLWLLMHLSANFAHARRDMADARASTAPRHSSLGGDAIAALHVAPYASKKAAPASQAVRRDQDAATGSRFTSVGAEFTGVEGLPDSVIEPVAPPAHEGYGSAYEAFQETPVGGAAVVMAAAEAAAVNGEGGEAPSPGSSRGATFNTTAQRYAAYRLRAAQAAAAKSSPAGEGRKQWQR